MSIKKKLKKMLQAQKQVEAESAPLPSQPEAVVPEVLEPVSANDPGQAMHRVLSRVLPPVKVRIVCPHKYDHVRTRTLKNIFDASAVIRKIIFFKHLLIGKTIVLLPCQQVHAMAVFG